MVCNAPFAICVLQTKSAKGKRKRSQCSARCANKSGGRCACETSAEGYLFVEQDGGFGNSSRCLDSSPPECEADSNGPYLLVMFGMLWRLCGWFLPVKVTG